MSYRLHVPPRGALALAALALGLAGCSVHPLPEDVSRVTTFDIVERIRCEAREGLLAFRGDPAADKIIAEAKIGLEFDFNIDEINDGPTGSLAFERSSLPAFSLVLNATKTHRKRENDRTFETLEELSALYEADCSRTAGEANREYPITGRIGIAEVIQTYIRLEKLTKLAEFDDDDVFSDELVYQTVLSTSATVNMKYDTGVGTLRLTNASLTGSASRDDTHSVTIALSRDPPPKEKTKAGVEPPVAPAFTPVVRRFDVQSRPPGRRGGRRERFRELLKKRIVGGERVHAALLTKDATAENRILRELQRRRNLEEDRKVVERVLGRPLD